jgi:hypothetical protein
MLMSVFEARFMNDTPKTGCRPILGEPCTEVLRSETAPTGLGAVRSYLYYDLLAVTPDASSVCNHRRFRNKKP